MESSTVCCSLEVHHLGSYLSLGQLLSHCMNTAPASALRGPDIPPALILSYTNVSPMMTRREDCNHSLDGTKKCHHMGIKCQNRKIISVWYQCP